MSFIAWELAGRPDFAEAYAICRASLQQTDYRQPAYWRENRAHVVYITPSLALCDDCTDPRLFGGDDVSVECLPTISVAELPFPATAEPTDAVFFLAFGCALADHISAQGLFLCRADAFGRLTHRVESGTDLLLATEEATRADLSSSPVVRAPWKLYN